MAELMDLVTQAMGGDTTNQIGSQLGADQQTTQTAISAALPLLLAALAHNSQDQNGARSLHDALARDHDGSILEDPGSTLANAETGPGAAILGHVLGARQPLAQQAVSKASGLDAGRAAQLLTMLAPMVLGALGRTQRQRNLDPSAMAGMLGQEREDLNQTSPDLMGLATRMLDKDGDGSIMNDLGGIAGKLFGRN